MIVFYFASLQKTVAICRTAHTESVVGSHRGALPGYEFPLAEISLHSRGYLETYVTFCACLHVKTQRHLWQTFCIH